MPRHLKGEPPIHIHQIVEFVEWTDAENHKDGPKPGDHGIVADIVDQSVGLLHQTYYVVTYKPFSFQSRTIYHLAPEIRPLVSLKEMSHAPRPQDLTVSTN